MATTPNYSWVMPDPTDFVTDLPADFEIFGDAVDASLYALNPGTTAGDVDYYTSATAKARLGIGTAGQVLAVNSGATAPEWITVSAGGTNWTLLNAGGTALTGAQTVTVSGISSVDKIMILVYEASSATSGASMEVRVNGDTAGNYDVYGAQLEITSAFSADSLTRYGAAGFTGFRFGKMGSNAGNDVSGAIFLSGCAENGAKAVQVQGSGTRAFGGNGQIAYWYGGVWDNSAAVTSVSIFSTTGNLDGGTVFVYTSAN
jgi:hypothetical protein